MKEKELYEKLPGLISAYNESVNMSLKRKIITGKITDLKARKQAKFNGVYIIIGPEGDVLYVGSAFAKTFPVSSRLYGEYAGNNINSSFKKRLSEVKNMTPEEASKYARECSFIAIECESLEYFLMNRIPGLINKKGYKNVT